MKALSDDLQAHLDSGTTTLAWCWRITRSDGQAFGFTDHDRTLTFDGTDFESEAGLIPSELRQGSELSVDAQDAEGVLSSDRITEADIIDGRWDNADGEVFRVNWQDTDQRVLMRRGSIGEIRRGLVSFVAEVRSMAHVLNQQVGRSYQATCDAALGDARCRVNLASSAVRGSGAVASVPRGRVFTTTALGAYEVRWFAAGVVEWTSGENQGRKAEVMRHDVDGTTAFITLMADPIRTIAEGDTFTITAGCDKRIETCAAKFSNAANFRGFPDIPGPATVLRYATQGNGNTGRVL
jgi:uncharacterized phage protein (TIGR02218 family)